MKPREIPGYLRDTILRMLPHRAPTGLVPVGRPGPYAPVLLTGNFTLTVRRLKAVLRGRDAWLLCANSKGVNVWCAAGGGHLTHHDVISVLRTSRMEQHVAHNELILPQLCATGVERRKITEATGWETRWGPARLEDLPQFLQRGGRVHAPERRMRFPLWERMEMATMWSVPTLLVAAPVLGWLGGFSGLAAAALGMAGATFSLFALLRWLPVRGGSRWLTFGAFALLGLAVSAAALWALSGWTTRRSLLVGVANLVAMAVLAVDLEGTTPWYGSYINTFRNVAHITLDRDACTGEAECVQVCPSDVLHMDGKARKVVIERPGQCIQCGACIVQCPSDALFFRYDDGRVLLPGTVRTTRMNLAGRRTIVVRE